MPLHSTCTSGLSYVKVELQIQLQLPPLADSPESHKQRTNAFPKAEHPPCNELVSPLQDNPNNYSPSPEGWGASLTSTQASHRETMIWRLLFFEESSASLTHDMVSNTIKWGEGAQPEGRLHTTLRQAQPRNERPAISEANWAGMSFPHVRSRASVK